MGIVFLVSGAICISLISDEGREITLFRPEAGECCVTTASCVISQITFDTLVSAAADSELLVIPSPLVSRLAESDIYFRAFLYETETERFSQAVRVIQELLFKRFDRRLAACLLARYDEAGNPELTLTQEELARDANSAREVVARMPGHFSRDGLIEVRRGRILLKDIEGLRALL